MRISDWSSDVCSSDLHVPSDHLLRSIDRFVDLGYLREHMRAYYSETGRPSIDPELMIRMLIIGYCMGIRSERRLCEEVRLNLAYRWFCRRGSIARCTIKIGRASCGERVCQ